MTQQEFEVISKLSSDEFSALDNDTQIEYLNLLKEKNKSQNSNNVPIETYVEAGAYLGIEVADTISGATDTVKDIVSKKTTETLSGTQTAIIYLKMVQSVYSITSGQFKWDLLNTVSLLSSTLACLTAIGINIACMTALTTILASNPFTFGLSIIVGIINYFSIGNQLAKLKKQYLTCYNSYRRIKKLCKWCDTNEVIYTGIKRVIEGCKDKCNEMISYLTENEKELNNMMMRKIFIGAEFNSFCLFTNIITFIQSAQDLSTTREGVYNDYIDFCSIEDYIDTHEIIKQDKCRIEYYILQGDTYGLKNFTIALDYLKGFFETYKLNKNLTKQTLSDINYVNKSIEELNNAIGTQNLLNLQKENEKFLDNRNPEELFNSIYSYLVYSQSMKNSPFVVSASLLNPEYYKEQDIYEYVSAFSEYPVFLFSKWFFYFGNIMYNDIYIENYKSEMINAYNKDKQLYDYSFMKDLTDNINTFNDYKIILLWLFSIREFIQNILDKEYKKYSPTYATSITQTAVDKDGKTLYNFYLPNESYLIPKIKTLIENFVYYMKNNGYDKDRFSYLLKDYWILNNTETKFEVPFLDINGASYVRETDGYIDKFGTIDNSLKTGKLKTVLDYKGWRNFDNRNNFNDFLSYIKNINRDILSYGGYLNIADKRSVNNDGNRCFGKIKVDIDTLTYFGESKDINDFYFRILDSTKDINYIFTILVLIFDGRWSYQWGNSWFEIAYILSKSQHLRELFFNGYSFKSSHNIDDYYYSLWEYLKGEREDIIFYWADNYCPDINMQLFVNDMINNSNFKIKIEELYNNFKNVYNDFIDTIKYDIKFATNTINEQIANFETILDKYVKYDSSLSYAYTDKNNTYLWNLYKTARDLSVNNKGYITNIERNLIPVYKLKDGYIQLETYYPPMFILMSAQDDSNISQAYYLFNKTAINSLFDIANEKFSEKVNEFKELIDLSIQPIKVEINHDKILQDIKIEIEKSYNVSYDELINRIGNQEDEYILMENLTNTEILKSNNEKVNSSNEQLALQTQKDIDNTRNLLDNKKVIKYTILGGVGFIVAKFLGRK